MKTINKRNYKISLTIYIYICRIRTPRKSQTSITEYGEHEYIKLDRYIAFACLRFRSMPLHDFVAIVRREFLCKLAALSGCVLLDNDARSKVAAAKRNRPVQRHGNKTRAEQSASENNAATSKPNSGHTGVMQQS